MKKNWKNYLIIWFIFVAMFNVLVFVTPNEAGGMSKFGGAFWPGYIFIMLAFLGQLGCTWYEFKDNEIKTFYKIPVLSISYVSLIVMLVIGSICMIIPNFPVWLGVILCFVTLGVSVVAGMQAEAAGQIVNEIDNKIKSKTMFIKLLIVDAETLMDKASSETIKEEIKKVCEAVRYSDPMSDDALAGIESQITIKFSELSDKVKADDEEETKKLASELVILIRERNRKCKILK